MSGQCWILSLAVLSAFLMGLLDKIWMIANTDYPLPDQRFKLLSRKKKIVRLKVFKKEKFFWAREWKIGRWHSNLEPWSLFSKNDPVCSSVAKNITERERKTISYSHFFEQIGMKNLRIAGLWRSTRIPTLGRVGFIISCEPFVGFCGPSFYLAFCAVNSHVIKLWPCTSAAYACE